jgi:hypothetical protein
LKAECSGGKASHHEAVTDFQDLAALIEERTGHFQVLVAAGPAREHVAPQLRSSGRLVEVVRLTDTYLENNGPFDVFKVMARVTSSGSDLLVTATSILDPALARLLAEPWPVTLVQTSADPWAPIESVDDWLRGHRFEVLKRVDGRLERQHPQVRALTRRDLGTSAESASGAHFFAGPWEELRAHGFSAEALLGVEVLGSRWDALSPRVLETVGALMADSTGMSLSSAVEAAKALEE